MSPVAVGGSNPTPRTIENVLTLVSEVWVVGFLILLEGLSLLCVVVGLSFFRVLRLVVRGIPRGVSGHGRWRRASSGLLR